MFKVIVQRAICNFLEEYFLFSIEYFLIQLVVLCLHHALSLSVAAETPLRSSSLTSGSLGRLLAPRRYNFKDDMEIFSQLLEVQSNTHSFDQLWDGRWWS
ncbi:unnamed protein product [Fraxinus pennsylvanica]|uniref:Uncharacterized protein n=1 Tax=Fraxinus pennsylvanica TaxID=56036 RepID=A0AAD1ZRK9_9LAMI|nr:unnamed protein product [Fraxinus pennsylvanica]